MSWPERTIFTLATAIAGLFVVFWLLLAVGVGSPFVPRLNASVVRWTYETEAAVIGPLWLLLRAVHFLIGWAWPPQKPVVRMMAAAPRPATSLDALDLTQVFSEKAAPLARDPSRTAG